MLAALSVPAFAQEGSAVEPPQAPASALSATPVHVHNVGRPIFLGLIAAVFLVLGATVGANDHPDAQAERKS